MTKLPQLDAIKLSKILKKLGFKFIRQRGSHMFFKHSDGRTTVIPHHSGDKIGPGLLLKIIKEDLQLSRKKFEELL
ncbi:hypothetical protein CMI40_01300 [Candidatus Pacearchaeota archaeon]|mgnify:FL=1|jgi:predicted RNA binding protein YcfA (HicA-like mRNA interferase family)|nr:hypothetical protein [Candidatus Pacearchaeota archaeon]|tara:strand:- start:1912 stop:2139 length:228 start_codon:yes stop_codon:yes gene_type:complete